MRGIAVTSAWTVRRVLDWTTSYFREAKIEAARLEAEILVAHALGADRLELYLRPERLLSEAERRGLRALVQRRVAGEPIQYLIGLVQFYHCQLKVSEAVLIPRPETEELLDHIVRDFPQPPRKILDLGTGSGAMAIALARAWPQSHFVASDISPEALELACQNAIYNGVHQRITFAQSDWWSAIEDTFDLIVSNPPYVRHEVLNCLQREVQREPRVALDGGREGLEAITQIIERSPYCLNPGGWLYLEIGRDQAERVRALLREAFAKIEIRKDLSGQERFARAARRS